MDARLELDFFVIVILAWVTYKLNKDADERDANLTLCRSIYIVLTASVLNVLLIACEGRIPGLAMTLLYTVYYCVLLVMGFYWFIYSGLFTKNKKMFNKENRVTFLVVLALEVIFALLSPWVHILYTADPETGYIVTGLLGKVMFYAPYAFILFASVQFTIALIFDPETRTEISYETIAVLIGLPMLTIILTLIFENFNALPASIAISIMFIYFDFHVGHVSTDGLTGLNNKKQYLHYITSAMQDAKGALKLYLVICDLDYFKEINDNFGHAEGDKALIEVAGILKKVCSDTGGSFLARYGGDEFAVVFKARFVEDVVDFKDKMEQAIADRNKEPGVRYKLSMSIGYAKYEYGQTLETLTEHADEMLYYEKEDHHQKIQEKRNNI